MEIKVDVLVIGCGPAGMAAALSAKENGAESVLIVERNDKPGGILNQCIHTGFGLYLFGEELTGPEFAGRYIKRVYEAGIPVMLNTMVLTLSKDRTVTVQNEEGIQNIRAKAVIIATGCRERPRGVIGIPGTRPAGIFTAGTAQKLINCKGFMPGKRAVILGSGDIGLIMARRLTLEGAKVEAVCEILPYSSGLTRNVVQCLEDFDIPLYLSHTVTRIFGKERICGVEISKVDEDLKPIAGSERRIDCDMLLLSVGLIPENEVIANTGVDIDKITGGPVVNERLETTAEGIYSCGNSLHVHDLADYASEEAAEAGRNAAMYTQQGKSGVKQFAFKAGEGVNSVVPQYIKGREATVYIRVKAPYRNAKIEIKSENKVIKTIKGNIFTPAEMVKAKIEGIDGDLTAVLIPEGGALNA